MKLTCVTATFNCIKSGNRERLIRCIESVAKLQAEHEHLIYDGASADGTADLLRELEKRTPCLKVMSEPDAGIYNALNKGVRDAKGEWFYVLGADDFIIHSDIMDELLYTESLDTQVIVSPVDREKDNRFFRNDKDMRKLLFTVPYSHQGLIMRTSLVQRLGGFDERYRICADWDLMFKAHEAAVSYHYTYKPFAFYSVGGVSECGDGNGSREVLSVLQRHIGLSDSEVTKYRNRGYWPMRKVLPYLGHKDWALRLSARYLLWKMLRFYLRIAFYPIVVAVRPFRKK